MKQTVWRAVCLTAYGKLADATFPQALENPPGFPQTHSSDDEISLLTAYRGTVSACEFNPNFAEVVGSGTCSEGLSQLPEVLKPGT